MAVVDREAMHLYALIFFTAEPLSQVAEFQHLMLQIIFIRIARTFVFTQRVPVGRAVPVALVEQGAEVVVAVPEEWFSSELI